ncbi:MAG: hypothetical protein HS111_06020 [Kofleriaceae bacterium]|nr:hypothetical protein [Kofleriaceae bacterium]MCL4225681.1 hypothetical protein [Myxococcales bacterium]
MRFWLGLAIGLALGATGTYLALEPPWRGEAPAAPPEVAEVEPGDDAGAPTRKKGRRKARGGGSGSGGAAPYEIDEQVVLTDADRRPEWRGDAVALPARTLDLGQADDGRPLDDGEIQAGLARGSGAIVGCIQDATAGAALQAEVTVQLLVGADGKVGKLRVRAPAWLHRHGLLACARRAARGFGFPATGAPTVVTAPFHLE